MRVSHRPAPLHRVEYWNGSFFKPASLWEVGTYLLVQHHEDQDLCETLLKQRNYLESQQDREDDEEQKRLRNKRNEIDSTVDPVQESGPGPGPGPDLGPNIETTLDDDACDDAAFESGLNSWLNNFPPDSENILEENLEFDDAVRDIQNVVEYLGPNKESDISANDPGPIPTTGLTPGPDAGPTSDPRFGTDDADPDAHTRPKADGLNNVYVRVIHTNGIHHIGMVTCSCRGHNKLPLDLIACRLFPASFIKIRTIFTAQLMDYFRLCNLELKASAYQFYLLLRRLTLPMGQSDMVNLYHEFRRMSRLWRWMKKLKWAGYGHNQEDHLNPPAGSLSIFCPTCPQPAVNLPEDWKLDKNRSVFPFVEGCFMKSHQI